MLAQKQHLAPQRLQRRGHRQPLVSLARQLFVTAQQQRVPATEMCQHGQIAQLQRFIDGLALAAPGGLREACVEPGVERGVVIRPVEERMDEALRRHRRDDISESAGEEVALEETAGVLAALEDIDGDAGEAELGGGGDEEIEQREVPGRGDGHGTIVLAINAISKPVLLALSQHVLSLTSLQHTHVDAAAGQQGAPVARQRCQWSQRRHHTRSETAHDEQ